MRELERGDIVFKFDDNGLEYATLGHNPHEKNHQGINHHSAEHEQKMFATNGPDCPVTSLKFYLSKLNPDCPAFFQRPKSLTDKNVAVWYCKQAVGRNAIGTFMSVISDKAGLKNRYTNHCIRATTVTRLRDDGVDPQDIVAVTGHRCVASIGAYSKTNLAKRKEMSHTLSKVLGKNVTEKKKQTKHSFLSLNRLHPKPQLML